MILVWNNNNSYYFIDLFVIYCIDCFLDIFLILIDIDMDTWLMHREQIVGDTFRICYLELRSSLLQVFYQIFLSYFSSIIVVLFCFLTFLNRK